MNFPWMTAIWKKSYIPPITVWQSFFSNLWKNNPTENCSSNIPLPPNSIMKENTIGRKVAPSINRWLTNVSTIPFCLRKRSARKTISSKAYVKISKKQTPYRLALRDRSKNIARKSITVISVNIITAIFPISSDFIRVRSSTETSPNGFARQNIP